MTGAIYRKHPDAIHSTEEYESRIYNLACLYIISPAYTGFGRPCSMQRTRKPVRAPVIRQEQRSLQSIQRPGVVQAERWPVP